MIRTNRAETNLKSDHSIELVALVFADVFSIIQNKNLEIQ